ncbi:MAG TPA: sulfatase/phosphatase domain-containing protein, partial [Planctomycetota bacterium]|nr:sulfatase/phosphatase domain-containing protein [Planctomycetota bacterium]
LMGKQNVYEPSVRVPLIVAGPNLPAGAVNEALCYQHDLHPTLLELAGLPAGNLFFESLLPVLRGQAKGRGHVVSHYRQWQRMIRDDRYKLISYLIDHTRREQLFDLHDDPWELHDLAADPAHADRLIFMRLHLPDESGLPV